MPPAKQAATPSEQWEEIAPFTEPRKMEEGEEIVSFYLGSQTLEVKDDTEEEGKRTALLHEFQDTPDSEPFGIWGSANLDKRLADVPANSRVKVRYDGKVDLDGGRTARQYRVWQDKSAKF